jgi:hypothetical protein
MNPLNSHKKYGYFLYYVIVYDQKLSASATKTEAVAVVSDYMLF